MDTFIEFKVGSHNLLGTHTKSLWLYKVDMFSKFDSFHWSMRLFPSYFPIIDCRIYYKIVPHCIGYYGSRGLKAYNSYDMSSTPMPYCSGWFISHKLWWSSEQCLCSLKARSYQGVVRIFVLNIVWVPIEAPKGMKLIGVSWSTIET